MKKKTISVLLAAVLLFSLAACGSAAQTQRAPQQTQESVTETALPHPTEEALEQEPAVTAEVSEESGSEILVLFFSRTGEQVRCGSDRKRQHRHRG